MRRHLVDLYQEEFWILLMGRSQKVLGKELISRGGLSDVLVDPKIVYSIALRYMATGIILIHNHPSGNLKPSSGDIAITKRLSEAGKLLEIQVLDHLIITDKSYFSFADEGVI